jgi:hypothetical protein
MLKLSVVVTCVDRISETAASSQVRLTLDAIIRQVYFEKVGETIPDGQSAILILQAIWTH